MNRIIFTLLFIFIAISDFAQELTVKSFGLATNDITASTQLRNDNNGDACALVKVLFATPGATFNGNTVGAVSYNKGEYWVYLTEGSKSLQVKHEKYLPLFINFADYGVRSVASKRTYVLTLLMPQSGEQQKQDLSIKVSPANAIVLVDGDMIKLKDGKAELKLAIGSHTYNVVAEGYAKQLGEVKLTANARGKLIIELDKEDVGNAANVNSNTSVTASPNKTATTSTSATSVTSQTTTTTQTAPSVSARQIQKWVFIKGMVPEKYGAVIASYKSYGDAEKMYKSIGTEYTNYGVAYDFNSKDYFVYVMSSATLSESSSKLTSLKAKYNDVWMAEFSDKGYRNSPLISGVVLDKKTREPIIGASIVEGAGEWKENARGAVSDLEGRFSFFAEKYPGTKITVNYIGCKKMVLNGAQDMVILLDEE